MGRTQRRALGTYYTPKELVDHLVAATLGPILEEAERAGPSAAARRVLALRVLDPAMGDGAFLAAAAEMVAARLARAAGGEVGALASRVRSRCLRGVEIDPEATRLARAALPEAAAGSLVTADALAVRFPLRGPFHAVVGNPPWGGWDRTLPAAARLDYRRRFATARGRLDPFALFLERVTDLLEPGGRVGLALPDVFLLKNYPHVRRLVLDHYRIEELVHWGRAFPGVNLDACTMVAERAGARAPAGHRVRCFPDGPAGRERRIPQARFAADPRHAFNLRLDDGRARLLRRLESRGVPLGTWLEAHEGIHSGNSRAALFVPPGRRSDTGSAARPLVMGGGEVGAFRVDWAGWRVRYDRRTVRAAPGGYANLGRPEWFAAPKLLVRRTGDRVIAALDRRGLLASNNLFVARARPACPVPLEYLEGYLNSALATWSFRAIQPRAGRLFAELKLLHLRRLPVPPPSGDEDVEEVVRLVKRLRASAGHEPGRDGGPGRRAGAAGRARAAPGDAPGRLDAALARLAGLTASQARLVAREGRTPARRDSL